jgi:hypothetical protein
MAIYQERIPDKHRNTKEFLHNSFRDLDVEGIDWLHASDPTESYNCMGFALGIEKWLEPPIVERNEESGTFTRLNPASEWLEAVEPAVYPPDVQWPIEHYVRVAILCGFKHCSDGSYDDGLEKIMLFHDGKYFRHAAIQRSAERWESKIGWESDFSHSMNDLDGDGTVYGSHRIFMCKPITPIC